MAGGLSIFPISLREGLVHAKIISRHVASAVSSSLRTVTQWMNGTVMPAPINAWKLSTLLGRRGPKLLVSYIYWC